MTGKYQTDPTLDRLLQSGNMGVFLAARILALVEDSGAAKVEVISALGVIDKLLATLPMSFDTGPTSSESR